MRRLWGEGRSPLFEIRREEGKAKLVVRDELLLIDILTAILILIITAFPQSALRVILGLPFILFFPGYALIAALFPRRGDLGDLERIALSFGLSIAVVPLVGLVLNYTPWGIRLYPILISLSCFIFAASGAARLRRRRYPPEERFLISIPLPAKASLGTTFADRILTAILICAVAGAVGALVYVISHPKVGERFTEFYILGPEGLAEGYPAELHLGEKGEVILGIVNHEHEDMNYAIRIRGNFLMEVEGKKVEEIGPLHLSHEEKWEERIYIIPEREGEKQKAEFILCLLRTLGRGEGKTALRVEPLGGKLLVRIGNLGEEAEYQVRIEEEKRSYQSEIRKIPAGGEEVFEIPYARTFGEQKLLIFRGGEKIYEGRPEDNFLTLHLWIDVLP